MTKGGLSAHIPAGGRARVLGLLPVLILSLSTLYPLSNVFEFTYNSEANGDGVKMSKEGHALSLLEHLRPQASREGTPDAAPAENQGFSPGDPELPRPRWFLCVPGSGRRGQQYSHVRGSTLFNLLKRISPLKKKKPPRAAARGVAVGRVTP